MQYILKSDDETISWGLSGTERILQNVLNILRTYKREVMFMPMIGIDPEIIDNTTEYIKENIAQEIIDQLALYENRAELLSVKITKNSENNDVIISVEMEV